jgi:hypothetical protein
MKKKDYISPQSSVELFATELMYLGGPASAAPDPHASGAPAHWKAPVQRTPVF